MVGEIASALTSLKAIKDISEAMIGLRDAAAFQEKRLELQSKLLDAQAAIFAANEERSSLVQRIGSLEQAAEPAHHICATCYQGAQKSILQPELRFPGRCDVLVCHRCGADLYLSGGPEKGHVRGLRSR